MWEVPPATNAVCEWVQVVRICRERERENGLKKKRPSRRELSLSPSISFSLSLYLSLPSLYLTPSCSPPLALLTSLSLPLTLSLSNYPSLYISNSTSIYLSSRFVERDDDADEGDGEDAGRVVEVVVKAPQGHWANLRKGSVRQVNTLFGLKHFFSFGASL